MNEPKTIRVIFRRDGDVVLVRSDVLDGGDPGTIKVTTVRMRRGDTLKGSLNGRNGDHHHFDDAERHLPDPRGGRGHPAGRVRNKGTTSFRTL